MSPSPTDPPRPERTYGVGTFLVVKARTTVWAYGATIRSIHANRGCLRNFMPDDSFTGYGGHSRISVLGGVWDGNASDAERFRHSRPGVRHRARRRRTDQ